MASSLFEPALIDRLRGQYEHVDVHAIAEQVRDMAKRKPVRNPSGLLVTWVRKAARQSPVVIGTAADRDELYRYAELHVRIYRDAVTRGLSPREIASRLANARANGYPRLNSLVVDALRSEGESWQELACS